MDQMADDDMKLNRINDDCINMKYKIEDFKIKVDTVSNQSQHCLNEWINFRQTMTNDMNANSSKTAKKVLNYFKDITAELEAIKTAQAEAAGAVQDVESLRTEQAGSALRIESLQEQADRIEETYARRDKWLEKDYIVRTMIEGF